MQGMGNVLEAMQEARSLYTLTVSEMMHLIECGDTVTDTAIVRVTEAVMEGRS